MRSYYGGRCGEDGEVGAQRTELRCAGDPQRQAAFVVADPHAQLIFVRFRIVGGDRQSDCRHCSITQAGSFRASCESTNNVFGLFSTSIEIALRFVRGQVESAKHVKERKIVVRADRYFDSRSSVAWSPSRFPDSQSTFDSVVVGPRPGSSPCERAANALGSTYESI